MMDGKTCALYSPYIIDGIQQDSSPAQILNALIYSSRGEQLCGETIVDESLDPPLKPYSPNNGSIEELLKSIVSVKPVLPLYNMDFYTRSRLASALLELLWRKGNFRLGNLQLDVKWMWNEAPVGAMAAFYESANAVAGYLDDLGLSLSRYGYQAGDADPELEIRAHVAEEISAEDEAFEDDFFRLPNPEISAQRACADELLPDEKSWVVFVPFDTADFLLGASLCAQSLGIGGAAPKIGDADYFIDCYEVVREFVEDDILLSAVSVGEGGLGLALKKLTRGGVGLNVELSDVLCAYQERDAVKVLFSEIPGVLLQIRDSDFDYLDAELLLQDVAYFPLGHPNIHNSELKFNVSEKSGIQTILESLMQNAEGED